MNLETKIFLSILILFIALGIVFYGTINKSRKRK